MKAIEEIVNEIDKLAPIPQIMQQVMTLAEDPKASMTDIADVIVYDPTITAGIIKTCNSAYFSLPRKVDSLNDAIVLLGLNRVIELVLIDCVKGHLKNAQTGYSLREGNLWQYSVSTALMAKQLADQKGALNKQLIFTAALLKDIGKLILDRFVADSIDTIDNLVRKQKYSFREAEKEVLGLDHAELGGMIAEKWNFSSKLTFIIANHHMTNQFAVEDLETAIVYLAEIITMMVGIGTGSDGMAYRFYKSVLKQLNVSENDIQEIMALFCESCQDVKKLLKMT